MLPIRLCLALVASTHAFAPPLRPAVGCKLHRCEEPPKSVICRASGGGGGASELTREGKLIVSILIDLIGMSTYLLPVAGEGADVGWAPVSAALIFWLYGSGIFAAAGFAEEILPGLDFVPTATIAWFLTQSDAGQRKGEKVTPGAAADPQKKKAEDLRDGAIDV